MNEIDLLELVRTIWRNKVLVLAISVVMAVLVGTISLFMDDEFESSTLLYPHISSASNNASGLLESLSGVSLNLGLPGSGDFVSQELFLAVFSSNSYLLSLADLKIETSKSDSLMTLSDFLSRFSSKSYLKIAVEWVREKLSGTKDSNTVDARIFRTLTYEDLAFISMIKEMLFLESSSNGFVSVTANLPDPVAVASFTQLAVNQLTQEVIRLKTEKLLTDLEYIEKEFEVSEREYLEAQLRLANYDDQNKNVVSETVRNRRDLLNMEFKIKSELYLSATKKREQLKVELKESTPLFSTIEPIYIPAEKSGPKRKLLVLIGFLAGSIVTIGYLAFKPFLKTVMHSLSQKESI